MADPQIEKLLIVQHRDVALNKIKQELARIPVERKSIETAIASEEANIETARTHLKSLEARRHELDLDVQSKEADLLRFRTQQISIKKNDEYQAMTQQIEQTQADISDLEEKEIELMLEIDSVREAFEVEQARIQARIVEERRQIDLLNERELNLKASSVEAEAKAAAAREGVDSTYLSQYERVIKLVKRLPVLVPIENHKCSGCHLRVSNEVSKDAMQVGQPAFCDQCSRMVYA